MKQEKENGRGMKCPQCGREFFVIFGDEETCLWDDQRLDEIDEDVTQE